MEIIIAMVVATMVTRAIDESKARAAEARQRVAERREEARRRRQAARAARSDRLDTARDSGPSDPLWWVWATGWTVAATVSGTAAAVTGARDGARTGVAEGYRLGRERAWQRQARRRREKAAYNNGRHAGQAEREAARPAGGGPHDSAPGGAQDAPGGGAGPGEVPVEPCPRCGAYVADPGACPCPIDAEVIDDHGGPASPAPPPWDAEIVDAEIVDDPTTNNARKEEGPMAQITSGYTGGDGEGYASTITALTEIKQLLQQMNEIVTDLGDTLTSKDVDTQTTGGVSDLDDHLQAAVQVTEQTLTHAQDRHEPVAAAISGAGGSGEIAQTDWYDDL